MYVQSLLRTAIVLLTFVSVGTGKVWAQSAGRELSVSATVQITVSVPSLLRMAGLEVVDVRRGKNVTEVESQVTVHGNVHYRVAVRAARLAGSTGVQVRDAAGAWMPLPEDGSLEVASGEPGVTSVRVQCRVPALAASAPTDGCALEYELSEGTSSSAPRARAVLAFTKVNEATNQARLVRTSGTF